MGTLDNMTRERGERMKRGKGESSNKGGILKRGEKSPHPDPRHPIRGEFTCRTRGGPAIKVRREGGQGKGAGGASIRDSPSCAGLCMETKGGNDPANAPLPSPLPPPAPL